MARHMTDLKRRELALQRAADKMLADIYVFETQVWNKASVATDDLATAWAMIEPWRKLLKDAKRGLQ